MKNNYYKMSQIKSSGTYPELIIRKLLDNLGIEYEINVRKIVGKPDIYIRKSKTLIFINGCFWHRHKKCLYKKLKVPKNEILLHKIENNVIRDKINNVLLTNSGYKVLVIWECEILTRNRKIRIHPANRTVNRLLNQLL